MGLALIIQAGRERRPLMVRSELGKLADQVLAISRPGEPVMTGEMNPDDWPDQILGLLGEVFLLGTAAGRRWDLDKAIDRRHNAVMKGGSRD